MNPLLPDVDLIVAAALREGLPQATVRVLWPDDWADHLPLIVVRQVAGGSADRRGIGVAVIDVQCADSDRRNASALARTARTVIAGACISQFSGPGGYLNRFADVTGGPYEIRTGTPESGPDLYRYQATYRVTVRPLT